MNNMKIRVPTLAVSAAVQAALFKLGYKWDSGYTEQNVKYAEKPYLYAYEQGYLSHSSDSTDYFESHLNFEYVLVDSELVLVGSPTAVNPPLGLRPRYVAEALRIQEILVACTRCTEAAKVIPTLWLDELRELNSRQGGM